MCGIVGVRRFGDKGHTWDLSLIDRMTDSLVHRGPDDRGVWTDDHIALGHRRLSIIDLSDAGVQPMANEDGSLYLTYNGEIYNFRELIDQFDLRPPRHVFRSRTDSEVLLHLFEELGPAMGSELNGIFAFGLWDRTSATLHLARDPFGVKPLFYHFADGVFRFASEIKALLADPAVPRRVNHQALHDYLTFNYVPGIQTAFADIYEVPPGTWMTVGPDGSITQSKFWQPAIETDASWSRDAATAEARRLMAQAVERQLVADVPLGVMLSGGLDSSALVAFMGTAKHHPIRTYSVGFEDNSFNELPFARQVVDHWKTIPHEVVVTADLVRKMLPDYLTYIDEPYADGSAIPTYYVCQAAREDVTVVLSGEGGDEAFAGYETYAAHVANQWFRRVPRWVRHNLMAPLINRLPVSHKKLSLEFKLKRFLGGQELSPAAAHLWWRIVLGEADKLALYSPMARERWADEPAVRHFEAAYAASPRRESLRRIMDIDATVFLPDDLMIKNDRMSMAHSLEARVPFTDPDLVRFAGSLPLSMLIPGLKQKHLMRESLRGLLPEPVRRKKKVGLEMPYSRWFRRELRPLLEEALSQERIAATNLFDPAAVARLITQHQSGQVDNGRPLWGLLNYVLWMETYDVSV